MNTEQLSSINQKILPAGQSFPQVTLPSGTKVQTGTVATMLHNIRLYDKGGLSADEKAAIEKELELSVPTLKLVGLFDLFSVDEWLSGTSEGRKFVGQKAKDLGVL